MICSIKMWTPRVLKLLALVLLYVPLTTGELTAQTPGEPVQGKVGSPTKPEKPSQGDPKPAEVRVPANRVRLSNDNFIEFKVPLASFSMEERAASLRARLNNLENKELVPENLRETTQKKITLIHLGEKTLFSVTDDDVRALGKRRKVIVQEYLRILSEHIQAEKKSRAKPPPLKKDVKSVLQTLREYYEAPGVREVAQNVGLSLLLIVVVLVLQWIISRVFRALSARLEALETRLPAIRIRSRQIVSPERMTLVVGGIFRILRFAISVVLIYYAIIFLVSYIPQAAAAGVLPYIRAGFWLVVSTATLFWMMRLTSGTFTRLKEWIRDPNQGLVKAVQLENIEFLSEHQLREIVLLIARSTQLLLWILYAYSYITIIFGLFPFSEGWSANLTGYVARPVGVMFKAIWEYMPSLFFIIIIVLTGRYLLRFTRIFFDGLERGRVKMVGFHADWARPTYRIVAFVLVAFIIVMVFPYLPGAKSEAFKGVGFFLGLLLSLGSSAVVANIVAGMVLTYMRPFKIGDRVKIADTVGDVLEKSLLVTRIRTVKNVEVTIPNGIVLGTHLINYSSTASETGLILHTAVTIGYDVPWRQVHELLLNAARATQDVHDSPEPYVLQKSLDDFYVSYELNVFTDKPRRMTEIYSGLHKNIQDLFNESGVEILSPHYRAPRDGNTSTIPAKYLPKDYAPPAFRVENILPGKKP